MWVTPGLVDAHVHFGQSGWVDARPDAVDVRERYPYEKVAADLSANPDRFYRSQICSGVTAVFDVGGYPWSVARVKNGDEDLRAPQIAATGPLLSTIDFWVNVPAERQFIHIKDVETARSGVRYLAALGSDAVKVWYIVTPDLSAAASEPAVVAAAEEARKVKLPLVVHATGLAEAKVALKAGVHLLVHSVNEQPVDEEFLMLAKKGGAIYCPTLTVFGGYARLDEAVLSKKDPPAADDPNSCVDGATLAKIRETARLDSEKLGPFVKIMAKHVPELDRIGRANLKRVAAAGIPIAMGTDAGNPLTLHGPSVYAEMEAMQSAGMTPIQVLVASTRGGAMAMGLEKEIGTVEKGKSADLLLVAGDPIADVANLRKVRYVVRGGVVRSIEELKATVAAARD
jgi:imidazolonepropionase-like amidohydrolase